MGFTRESIIECCKTFLGKPYVWGGESDNEGGFDCSGLVDAVLNKAGYKVCRSTAQGYRAIGKAIPFSQAKAGDLLYFGTPTDATHIAIYAGNATMYESIGNSHNNKAHPGKGVTLSNVTRRSDLIEVRTLFDDATQPVQNATQAKASIGDEWVRRLQAAIGAGVDGIAGKQTLGKCPNIKIGTWNNPVTGLLQERLGNFYHIGVEGGVDSDYGDGTNAAVLELKKQKGLDMSDGDMNPDVWRAILKDTSGNVLK